jgi:hypothetical protein
MHARVAVLFAAVLAVAGAACRKDHGHPAGDAVSARSRHPRLVREGAVTSPTPHRSADQERFVQALLTIYQHTRAANGLGPPPPPTPSLVGAATTVAELAPTFGHFWRHIAAAKLGASGLNRPEFRHAIQAMHINPNQLDSVLTPAGGVLTPGSAITTYPERVTALYAYLQQQNPGLSGIPTCNHTAPISSATSSPSGWSATATTLVELGLTPSQLATAADPQNWDNPCGHLFFISTFVTDPVQGTFPTSNCTVQAGSAKPFAAEWHGYLYENYAMLPFNDFANILFIDSVPTTDQYVLKYSLESPLCASIGMDSSTDGLWVDDGHLIGILPPNNSMIEVTATKTIGFLDSFPHYPPATLAQLAAPLLEIMGDAIPFWICCPLP